MRLKGPTMTALALALVTAVAFGTGRQVGAQPAKGAPAAFERVRDVMANRFRDEKLSGDPDRDFAALLAATYEELVFLSKTQLEYGGDRHLRDLAQKIQDDQKNGIDDLKDWQFRRSQADYKTQPDQPQPGSGPLDMASKQPIPTPATPQPSRSADADPVKPAAKAPSNAPLVSGTVKKVDPVTGKITLDHQRIPNVDMDAMTMAYKVQAPALLTGLKPGDKVRFSAEDINGQTVVVRIEPVR